MRWMRCTTLNREFVLRNDTEGLPTMQIVHSWSVSHILCNMRTVPSQLCGST